MRAGSAIVEHQPGIRGARREIGIDRAERRPVEPGLGVSRRRLVVLDLDAVPRIGIQRIVGAENGIGSPASVPEVEVQPVPTGVIVHLPGIAPVGIACHRKLDTAGHSAREAEVEAREGLRLWAGGQSRIDVGVLPAGIGHGERIRTAVDHRVFNGPAPSTVTTG